MTSVSFVNFVTVFKGNGDYISVLGTNGVVYNGEEDDLVGGDE